jgi:ankyrin repeat protein
MISSRSLSTAIPCFVALALGSAAERRVLTQSPTRVDFARDVAPILQERCFGCHGPTQQMGGFRLDRRGAALRGAVRPVIIPGSGDSSRLYHRIIGSKFGPQMPPTGALSPAQIDTLKRWIDEGVDWPDALANEAPPSSPDQRAVRLNDAIRRRDDGAIGTVLKHDPSIVNARGQGGATPLMFAALFGDAPLVNRILIAGATVNIRDDFGTTALMWALDDVNKVRALLDHGADFNMRSNLGRSPLTLAAAETGSAAVIGLLLERGAKAEPSALSAAAERGDIETIRLLVQAGARDDGDAVAAAFHANCLECVEAITSSPAAPTFGRALLRMLPPSIGHVEAIRLAVERGANVNGRDAQSRTVLMKAVVGDVLPPDLIKLLIDRGADVNAKSAEGLTALDFAKRAGNPAVIDILTRAGAVSTEREFSDLSFVSDNTIPAAIVRSLPLLQRTAVEFYRKSGCVSCHHNVLTTMAVAAAREKRIAVDESLAQKERQTLLNDMADDDDSLIQGSVRFGGGPATIGYVLMGLAADHHERDFATDAMVRLLRLSQLPDGHWSGAYRPPVESSEFTFTAVNMRGIQRYASPSCGHPCEQAVQRAKQWLTTTSPRNTEDRTFRLKGLTWAHAAEPVRRSAIDDLLTTQRADGGWAQLAPLPSDAYATGEVLVALHEAGLPATNPAYTRGVQFLLRTQLKDGSWFVQKRAHPTQPFFDSGFPHGADQYVSAAATNWAILALIAAQ